MVVWFDHILTIKVWNGLRKGCFFFGFFGKINLFPWVFFSIFDIRIGKIHLFPRFLWIFAKIHLFPWVFYFFWKFHFFPWVFWIFDLETQKSKHPFEESQKNPKKPWEIQKSIFLTWIQRFCLKRWIFGFLVEQSSEIQDFIVWTWIQVFKLKDGLLYFCFHFLAEFRRLKKRINQEWLQLSFDLREQASYILYVCFHGFSSFHIALIYIYIYICLSPLGPTKYRAWGGLWPYIYISFKFL